MSIVVGNQYGLKFKDDFDDLDGIYTVSHAVDYNSLLLDDISLMTYLFIHVGKTEEDLDVAIGDIRDDVFFKIVHVVNESIYYVPRSYIVGIPDPNVAAYSKLMLTMDLGVFADPTLLATLKNSIENALREGAGIDKQVQLMQYGEQWLTQEEYETIAEDRETTRTGFVNYYEKYTEQEALVQTQNTKIAALEEIIRRQN